MRTHKPSGKVSMAMMLLFLCTGGQLLAQDWSISGNAGIAAGTNYLGTSDPNDMVFRSNAIERGRLLGTTGEWHFGTATNYVSIDVNGRLRFTGTNSVYQVAGNKYAFQFSGNPNLGLYFNSTLGQFEFRDAGGLPAFTVVPSTGAGILTGTLRVGTYTLPATDGAANQVLKTNGAGVLTWSADNNTTYTAGTGLSLVGTTFNNTAPDQVVSIAGSNGVTTSGTYPNFTVSGAGLWRTTGNAGTTPGTNFIGTTDAQPLAFRTSNIEKMRILADGKTGIGTTLPTARLHINGTSGEDALRIQTNGTTRLFVDDAGGVSIGSLTPGPAGGMYIFGSLGVGNSAPTNKLDVTGNIGLTGSVLLTDAAEGTGLTFTNAQTIRDNSVNTNLEVELHGDWLPDSDNSHSLGNSTQRWIDVWALDGTINTSDLRDKTNIHDMRYGLKEIMQLRPVSFNWKNLNIKQDKMGVIAQEIQKVMPEVVRDYELKINETTGKTEKVPSARLGVMYADIIPVLIKGMQDQQKIIEGQNQKIEALTQLVNRLANTPVVTSSTENTKTGTVIISSAVLDQNIPNPFNSSTSISYNLPQKFTAAQIVVTDKNGKTLKSIKVNNSGKGMLNIDASTLASGAYSYSLIVDGKIIDSKQMILAK